MDNWREQFHKILPTQEAFCNKLRGEDFTGGCRFSACIHIRCGRHWDAGTWVTSLTSTSAMTSCSLADTYGNFHCNRLCHLQPLTRALLLKPWSVMGHLAQSKGVELKLLTGMDMCLFVEKVSMAASNDSMGRDPC